MAEPRDEALRARYRALATEEPSAALDDAIRAAARRAVASAPGGARRSRMQRWVVPASVAAVLFLSFGVVMQMEQETPTLQEELMRAPPAASAPAAPAASAPAAKSEGRLAEAPYTQLPAPVAAEPPRQAPREVAMEPARRKEKKAVDATLTAAPAKPASPAPATVPAPEPSAVPPPAPAPVARPAPAPFATQREAVKDPAPLAKEMEKRDAPAERAAAAPAPQPRAFSDSTAPARAEERNLAPGRREDSVGAAASGLAASRAKTESFEAPRAAATPVPKLSATAPGAERLEPWPDTIDRKLERIEALRKAGRDKEADEAIARFRREHPDYRIPEDVWNRIKPR